jgi:hypothetical protein
MSNTGENNTGYGNTGNSNTGDWNTGYGNTGNRNTGDWNTGDWNTGYCNTGNRNTGNRNTGYRNTGDWNTGDCNTGYCNTGDWNTGDRNTGDCNTGDCNTGYCNTGDRNTGMFCSIEPTLIIFNKPSNKKWNEIDHPHFNEFHLTIWIGWTEMTAIEKKENPKAEITEGYLKSFTYQEAWSNFWKDTDENNKNKFLALPNFDAELFKDITGVDLNIDNQNAKKKNQILKKIEELKKEAESL